MEYFEKTGQTLIWRNGGETLAICPWGEDSLRVRAVMMGEIEDTRYALLDPVPHVDSSFYFSSVFINFQPN